MNKLAKALYDNTAECAEELAFRKGDILSVMDQNLADTSGWWMCSLYGKRGLAPANRLQLIPVIESTAGSRSHYTDKNKFCNPESDDSVLNIYQIPSLPPNGQINTIYKIPSNCLSASVTLNRVALQQNTNTQAKEEKKVYESPPSLHRDRKCDIPAPSVTEAQHKVVNGYSTLPNPGKADWIYDIPAGTDKQGQPQSNYNTIPAKCVGSQLYDTLPLHACPNRRLSSNHLLYDIPKPCFLGYASPPKLLPRVPIYDMPPTQRLCENVPLHEDLQVVSDPFSDHLPLECRGDSSIGRDFAKVNLFRVTCTSFRSRKGSGEDKERGKSVCLSAVESQRISTASNSSSSSCDSLSSSSLEPLREVTLGQDEACRTLLDLQEPICQAVPKLMEFVSSRWRNKEHLEKHLQEIQVAAEGIAYSVTCFLHFASDIKGNAQHLKDANLQARLWKQVSVVEDSAEILQQTLSGLNLAGWPLDTLCQDPGKVQTLDQLERFVMVARTVPEDVRRLVSIVIANGKLLFKVAPDPVVGKNTNKNEAKKIMDGCLGDLAEDDNDYVELQMKNDVEKQGKEHHTKPEKNATLASTAIQADKQQSSKSCHANTEERRPSSMSEHCRLYFGALQKAIAVFIGSLQAGQPPEKFISQSKLVIMVGQRLVDTLCKEAHSGGSSPSLLGKSNHLCALLKQLAVGTKRAALHFPDEQALHELQQFAKELSHRAQHFRISFEL
uniref:cas scaffolding protein family member 4 n=1 Tax=Doryrhamphus excisus TaxID=161450 RepID=UPI0025ADC656|nr:cas scaffolding protein family member 4 [Doryrhamphus excisus]XP_057910940.1 cas scaffolding protein family member 4 [Doryrhamphus excisus]XP_057910941.1 cas scaffolding protein family member 4 [Doryrhamphus excisus]